MKQQPQLLVRDALGRLFSAAAGGADAGALEVVDALGRWRESGAAEPALGALRTERGDALFDPPPQLAPDYAPLAEYVRDRALRFGAACAWLRRDQTLGDVLCAAAAAWDAGLFFEVHELLEPPWLAAAGARREALQGLIMAGAALHHLSEENLAGARALLRDAARKLRAGVGALERPWDLGPFADALVALAAQIESGEIRHIRDVGSLPPMATASSGVSDSLR